MPVGGRSAPPGRPLHHHQSPVEGEPASGPRRGGGGGGGGGGRGERWKGELEGGGEEERRSRGERGSMKYNPPSNTIHIPRDRLMYT